MASNVTARLIAPIDPAAVAGITAVDVRVDGRELTEADVGALARLPCATHLRIGGSTVSVAGLHDLATLRTLDLFGPATLAGLERLQQLETLIVYYFPKIRSLEPIGALGELRTLVLSTPPSYDASRKCHPVETLAPLARLTGLKSLTMRGVLPDDRRLEPLHALEGLGELEITHVYAFGLEHYAALARALPATRGHCLEPYFAAHWAGTCKRCGTARVALTAPPPRTPRVVCPECGKRRLAEHVARWYAHVGH